MSLLRLSRLVPASASSVRAASAVRFSSTAAAPLPEDTTPSVEELRSKAKRVYKELHRLGREYPDAEYNFNMRLRRAFEKNASITDPVKLQQQLDLAEHIKKEILAMYSLKKYRHLRRAYHATEAPRDLGDDFAQASRP